MVYKSPPIIVNIENIYILKDIFDIIIIISSIVIIIVIILFIISSSISLEVLVPFDLSLPS